MEVSFALATVETVALASVRIVAFLVVAPPFSHRAVPARVRAMLSVGLALAVLPRLEDPTTTEMSSFFGALVVQVVVGAALGFVTYALVAAVAAAGSFIDFFGGFQIAQAYDPQSMVMGAQFTRLFQMIAVVLMFVTGAYQVTLAGLAASFDVVPLHGGLDLGPVAGEAAHVAGRMFLVALQVAGPLVVVLFLADAALGLITRVAPALNAFVLGFPLKILLTLLLVPFVMLALPGLVERLADDSVLSFGRLLGVG